MSYIFHRDFIGVSIGFHRVFVGFHSWPPSHLHGIPIGTSRGSRRNSNPTARRAVGTSAGYPREGERDGPATKVVDLRDRGGHHLKKFFRTSKYTCIYVDRTSKYNYTCIYIDMMTYICIPLYSIIFHIC